MRKKLTFMAVLAAVALLLSVAVPAAAAGNTMANKTVSPDDDTTAVRVIGENITNGTANVTVFEIGTDGNETQVGTGTLDTSNSSVTTDTLEFATLNTSLDYRVLVEGDGADTLSINKVQVVAAGGGGSGDGLGLGMSLPSDQALAAGVIVLLFTAGGFILFRRD